MRPWRPEGARVFFEQFCAGRFPDPHSSGSAIRGVRYAKEEHLSVWCDSPPVRASCDRFSAARLRLELHTELYNSRIEDRRIQSTGGRLVVEDWQKIGRRLAEDWQKIGRRSAEDMAEECATGEDCGETGLAIGKNGADISSSVTAFFQSNDLICHLFNFLTDVVDRRNATLVCKSWKQMSHTFSTWRFAYLRVLSSEGDRLEDWGRGASMSTLKDVFLHCPYIARFGIECEYRNPPWWRDLAIFMPHVRWLSLTIATIPTTVTEPRPFILNDLPNLTFLQMSDMGYGRFNQKWWLSSITLRLPALETFEWTPGSANIKAIPELDFVCPNLKNLETYMWRGMVVNPSIYSHLRSLNMTILDLPESMLRRGRTEMVLDAFPLLTSLTLRIDDDLESITMMTLDLPSLEILHVEDAYSIENCNFSCPNLTLVDFINCSRMTLPEAMITRLKHISTHGSQFFNSDTYEEGGGAITLQCPFLEFLDVGRYDGIVSLTLDCPKLRTLKLDGLRELESCVLVSSAISDLMVSQCPSLDVSSMIVPTLESIDLMETFVDGSREWSLPKLTNLGLIKVRSTRRDENELERDELMSPRSFIVTDSSMEGCEFPLGLDVDCPRLRAVVTRGCPHKSALCTLDFVPIAYFDA